jgi:hypothetical protein
MSLPNIVCNKSYMTLQHVEQELLNLPGYLRSPAVLMRFVWLDLLFSVQNIVDRCLSFCSVSFYNLRFLVTPLVSSRRVWRYQRGKQNTYIEEEQTTQLPKEKVQKDKQQSTKHTYKTNDRVTKTGVELRCSGKVFSFFLETTPTSKIQIYATLRYIEWMTNIIFH